MDNFTYSSCIEQSVGNIIYKRDTFTIFGVTIHTGNKRYLYAKSPKEAAAIEKKYLKETPLIINHDANVILTAENYYHATSFDIELLKSEYVENNKADNDHYYYFSKAYPGESAILVRISVNGHHQHYVAIPTAKIKAFQNSVLNWGTKNNLKEIINHTRYSTIIKYVLTLSLC